MADWRERARALVDQLAAADQLHHPAWAAAVASVPRHVLVPQFYRQDEPPQWVRIDATEPGYLPTVYSNATLVTELADLGAGFPEPVSSSSQPSLMVRMLETLDVQHGQRVLEIGTGTGYNAALLAHCLHEDNTFSLDVAAHLVEAATDRLASLGLRPHLTSADGAAGWSEHARYDAILATCSVTSIPPAWIEQLAEGGRLLADLKVQNTAGNLVLLHRDAHGAVGRFQRKYGAFMALRHASADASPNSAATAVAASARLTAPGERTQRESTALILPTVDTVAWFLAVLRMPVPVTFGYSLNPDTRTPSDMHIYGADGSATHTTIGRDGAPHRVTETGPQSLWSHVEAAHQQWIGWGRPHWGRLGLTVDTATARQRIWLDSPDNDFFELHRT